MIAAQQGDIARSDAKGVDSSRFDSSRDEILTGDC